MLSEEFCNSSLQCLVQCQEQVYAEPLVRDAKCLQCPGSGNLVPKAP